MLKFLLNILFFLWYKNIDYLVLFFFYVYVYVYLFIKNN